MDSGIRLPPPTPSVFRRRWRLFLGIGLAVAGLAINLLTSSQALHAGVTLVVVFAIIVLIVSGNRPGGGGVDPHRYQSGNIHGGSGMGH